MNGVERREGDLLVPLSAFSPEELLLLWGEPETIRVPISEMATTMRAIAAGGNTRALAIVKNMGE